MPMRKFVTWATIGCSIWAVIVGSLGYAMGQGAQLLFGDLRRYEFLILIAMISIGAASVVCMLWRARRKRPVEAQTRL